MFLIIQDHKGSSLLPIGLKNFGVVKMGNYDIVDIINMDNIYIETNIGCKLVLKDVRYVTDLRLNLISNGRLDDEN